MRIWGLNDQILERIPIQLEEMRIQIEKSGVVCFLYSGRRADDRYFYTSDQL